MTDQVFHSLSITFVFLVCQRELGRGKMAVQADMHPIGHTSGVAADLMLAHLKISYIFPLNSVGCSRCYSFHC